MTGNDMPQMLKEMTPQSEANESPIRRPGRAHIISTPRPWLATTNSEATSSMTGSPQ